MVKVKNKMEELIFRQAKYVVLRDAYPNSKAMMDCPT